MANNTAIELIYEYIREQILIGNLKENEKISERVIGDLFGVSRTIVREAFYELKKNGWLYAAEKSGTYVSEVDNQLVMDNYEARIRLEPAVLAMAFPNITKEDIAQMRCLLEKMETGSRFIYIQSELALHLLIIQKTGNHYLTEFFRTMHEGMMRAASKTTSGSGQRQKESVKEWGRIIRYLESGDVHMAGHYLQAHMIGSYKSFRDAQKILAESGEAGYDLQ